MILLTLAAFLAASTLAQDTGHKVVWERIGKEKVDMKVETDSVSVDKNDHFRALKLRVIDAGVLIQDWSFEYQDKTVQHVPFRGFIRSGTDTPPIPIHKRLKKIRFKYQSISDNGKEATLEVLGQK